MLREGTNFDAFAHIDMISPRPSPMITGTKSATKWYSEYEIKKAMAPKELVVIGGLTHADSYDHVNEARAKLVYLSRKIWSEACEDGICCSKSHFAVREWVSRV
jgi:fermentation-respiration switch protein FrsA (DUF1100 family)